MYIYMYLYIEISYADNFDVHDDLCSHQVLGVFCDRKASRRSRAEAAPYQWSSLGQETPQGQPRGEGGESRS